MSYKIYIAGKVTGDEENACRLFAHYEAYFTERGYYVVNPMKLPENHDKTWKSYMRVCLPELKKCDAIFMQLNWENSRGARMDHWLAKRWGKTIHYEK